MTDLYGVVHGGHIRDIMTGEFQSVNLYPSPGFQKRLNQMRQGSRIGVEGFRTSDWDDILNHLNSLCEIKGLSMQLLGNEYWEHLIYLLDDMGHEIFFIDDKNKCMEYNEATIKHAQGRMMIDCLKYKKGEPERDYHVRLLRINEKIHKLAVKAECIQVLERDHMMLEKIASLGLDAVVAGIGHTDAWIAQGHKLKSDFGIEFKEYFTDGLLHRGTFMQAFREHSEPDPKLVFESVSMNRKANLDKHGKFTDSIPDWVGTWDVMKPSRGYFEMFIDDTRNTAGRIIDALGNASFEGTLTKEHFHFTKRYVERTENALESSIDYYCFDSQKENQFHGIYSTPLARGNFYIEKYQGHTPLEIGMSWFDHINSELIHN
jgi:hypothetical protein